MSLISVVIPTIQGREEHYARCVAAYKTRSHFDIRIVTVRDMPTCGEAWNAGAEQAPAELRTAVLAAAGLRRAPDFLHFSADDLEPHEGWDIAAVKAVELGVLPAPRIVNPAGQLDYCGEHRTDLPDWSPVRMSVIPFLPWRLWEQGQVGPVPPIHYFSDDYISWQAMRAGWPTVVRHGFAFTHHWAQPGRGAGMSYERRMAHDQALFLAATGRVGAAVA